jgi:hypothetical protein
MLWKKKRQIDKVEIDLDALKELTESSPPAKRWVNCLLEHMFRTKIESFVLSRSEGIPSIPFDDGLLEGELNFTQIINRLKVMSGLDPVVFKTQREGKVPLNIGGIDYTATTTFIDSDEDSKCSIAMSKGKA